MIRGFFVLEGGIHWWVTGLEPQAVIRDESSNLSSSAKLWRVNLLGQAQPAKLSARFFRVWVMTTALL